MAHCPRLPPRPRPLPLARRPQLPPQPRLPPFALCIYPFRALAHDQEREWQAFFGRLLRDGLVDELPVAVFVDRHANAGGEGCGGGGDGGEGCGGGGDGGDGGGGGDGDVRAKQGQGLVTNA